MSTKRITLYHPLIVEFLQSKIQPAQQSDSSECRLFDDDGSKYLLQREQDAPNVIRLSVSLAGFAEYPALSNKLAALTSDLQSKYQGACRVLAGGGSCQIKVELLCNSLLSLDAEQQLTQLLSIASIRADALTWPLR